MKKDITTSKDIKLLVDSFYKKVHSDKKIGHFFSSVMNVNWEEHLPKMVGFWEILLLGKTGMTSDPMGKHTLINTKEKLTEQHFDQWVKLWFETIDEMYEGTNAELAKERTRAIQQTMYQRIQMSQIS